jgi:excisionase family DNA binding protein
MPKYISAVEAARRLGVNEKTVRNWVRSGALDAHKPAQNRLDILAADVEALRRKREGYQDETSDVSYLVARTEVLERKYADLERKYSELEQKYAELSSAVIRKVEKQAVSQPVVAETMVTQKSCAEENRAVPVGAPADLPDGILSAVDFAKELGIEHSVLEGVIRHGLSHGRNKGKDYLDVTKIPSARVGYSAKFFTPVQQEAARALLHKHKRLPQTEE